MKERPRILKGQTFRVTTGLGKIYITVNEEDGLPFEVFVTAGKCGNSIQAKAEAIGRLVSLSLRNGVKVEEVIQQLKGIGGDSPQHDNTMKLVLSIPDAIAKILKEVYS